jgi:hypothetical protein
MYIFRVHIAVLSRAPVPGPGAPERHRIGQWRGVSQDLFRDGFRVAVEAGVQRRAATTLLPWVG